jgi:alpha-galactosidase
MREPVPMLWELNTWPQVFTGTVDGKKAVAIINEKDQDIEYKFEDITLDPQKDAEELLHPLGIRKYVITVKAHDAVLLVQD